VPQRLVATWVLIAAALLAVIGSGTFVVWKFVVHVTVPCSGKLIAVPAKELGPDSHRTWSAVDTWDMEIRWDEKPRKNTYDRPRYTNLRVVWTPADAACACSDAAISTPSTLWDPSTLRIFRDADTGLFVVQDSASSASSKELAVFRRTGAHGRRLEWDRVIDPHNLSMLIFVLSLGALGIATIRALRTTPYATRMHEWRAGTLRHDGLVEGEHGASLGMMELRSRVPSGPVIVDPRAISERDAYRGLPLLTRRNVGAGTHQQWTQGTLRRLQDARMLAIIAGVTTTLALVARLVGA